MACGGSACIHVVEPPCNVFIREGQVVERGRKGLRREEGGRGFGGGDWGGEERVVVVVVLRGVNNINGTYSS